MHSAGSAVAHHNGGPRRLGRAPPRSPTFGLPLVVPGLRVLDPVGHGGRRLEDPQPCVLGDSCRKPQVPLHVLALAPRIGEEDVLAKPPPENSDKLWASLDGSLPRSGVGCPGGLCPRPWGKNRRFES